MDEEAILESTEMGRQLKVGQEFWTEDFLGAAREEKDARIYTRLLALHHAQQKKNYTEIGKMLCIHTRSIHEWVKRYTLNGLAGLEKQPGQGRKRALDKAEEEKFKTLFMQAHEEKVGGRLTGEDAQRLLEQHFLRTFSLRTAYRLLHRVGLSWITGRDIHPQSNSAAQETFKKTLTSKSKKHSPMV
jgi:transposase